MIILRLLEDEVRFAATPGGIGTSRPSSEDSSLARARRPGSSSFEALPLRDSAGISPASLGTAPPGSGPGTRAAYRSTRVTARRLADCAAATATGKAPPSHTWRGLSVIVPRHARAIRHRHAVVSVLQGRWCNARHSRPRSPVRRRRRGYPRAHAAASAACLAATRRGRWRLATAPAVHRRVSAR